MRKLLFSILLILPIATNVWAKETLTTVVETLSKSSTAWNGDELPAYPQGKAEITILKITIPPHTILPLHQHPVINAGVLLKGELTVVTHDDKTLHMVAGDALIEVVDTLHYGENEGDEPAVIIVFYAGIQGEPVTIGK